MSVNDQSPTQVSALRRTRPAHKTFQRTYQACIPCRIGKAKCDLGGDSQPPCARCRREQRACVFSAERNYNSVKRKRLSRQAEKKDSILSARHDSQVTAAEVDLGDSTIAVSSGKDPLTSLFEAAAEDTQAALSSHTGSAQMHEQVLPQADPGISPRAVRLSQPSPEVLRIWAQCRFVKASWLSAEEAVTLVDLFFTNMCPLSPIVTDYYQSHDRHFELLTEEPLLTSTILMIASRYHLLPGVGAACKGFFMHEKLWQYCQHLINRILYGQEKSSNAQTRTIGSIEALLLISEWHPRALHFPPESEGWDTSIYLSPEKIFDKDSGMQPASAKPTRWLEDVIEPARRSDRMSWMLVGIALTLAHELGVFDDDKSSLPVRSQTRPTMIANTLEMRKLRTRKLLYVYINQLAARLGCSSMIPQTLTKATMTGSDRFINEWQSHMSSWIELTKLVKSVSDLFYPSSSVTRQLLNSGRYSSLLDHFLPLLEQWRQKHLDSSNFQGPCRDTLFIEYHYARIYINSIGMEAVCQRAVSEMDFGLGRSPLRTILDGHEQGFINEVIDGGIQILERTVKLAQADTLHFSPVRIFLRITTSSVFILKAISLSIRTAKLQSALDTLDRSIQAMRLCNLDDMHLAARFATLLETHVARLRRGFVVSSQKQSRRSHRGTQRNSVSGDGQPQEGGDMIPGNGALSDSLGSSTDRQGPMPWQDLSADDWLSLPFDPSMAPFGADGTFDFSALDGSALDFIWNIPTE